jgi:hypothetical protein
MRATKLRHTPINRLHYNKNDWAGRSVMSYGRGDRIRTCDPAVPNRVRYQTAPLPDTEVDYI